MKKTISINIGGNIFHIEEEGYDKLKAYLDSVHAYFATFEDSKEIIDDIENRIAEKFYTQLKKNKEAITGTEVDQLIASMGTVADFEATFDDEPSDQKRDTQTQTDNSSESKEEAKSKKLYRDGQRNVLGGVASGIAHYFSVDPIWVRLLWIVFTIAFGIGALAYIIFWIVLPESKELEEKKSIKKFFRNPDERVIGGVSSGIASYFGVDTTVIRVLFVVSLFLGGSGFILYLILWIITPEAKSVTEKMEMKGEPVTMSGIEKNVKKSFKMEEDDENIFIKILLFPFRLIAMIFEGLGRMLGPLLTFLVEAVRVVFGAFVLLAGFSIMISTIFTVLFMLGLDLQIGGRIGTIDGIPIGDFLTPLSPWATISAFFLVFIPALGIALLGLTIMLKKKVGNSYLAMAMVVIWILAVIGATLTIPRIIGQFTSDDSYEETISFPVSEGTVKLKLNELDWDDMDYEGVDLRLRGHEEEDFVLVLNKEAWGASRSEARSNAEKVTYTVTQDGNDFLFDSRLVFDDDAKFRFQNVDATFYIPYGVEFEMDEDLGDILTNTLHLNGYRGYQMKDNTWVFDEDGINCLTCAATPRGEREYRYESDRNSRTFEFTDFDEVRVSSSFKVKIYEAEQHSVKLSGSRGDMDQVIIHQSGDRLTFSHENEDEWNNGSRDVTIFIYMPDLEYFRASGECKGDIEGFNLDNLEIDLSGETDFDMDVEADLLDIDMSGAAKLRIDGDARELKAGLNGGSYLNSYDLDAAKVSISISGRATARVFADDEISVSASGESRVTYRGNPNATVSESGNSNVRQD